MNLRQAALLGHYANVIQAAYGVIHAMLSATTREEAEAAIADAREWVTRIIPKPGGGFEEKTIGGPMAGPLAPMGGFIESSPARKAAMMAELVKAPLSGLAGDLPVINGEPGVARADGPVGAPPRRFGSLDCADWDWVKWRGPCPECGETTGWAVKTVRACDTCDRVWCACDTCDRVWFAGKEEASFNDDERLPDARLPLSYPPPTRAELTDYFHGAVQIEAEAAAEIELGIAREEAGVWKITAKRRE